jgi:hypothetical protein
MTGVRVEVVTADVVSSIPELLDPMDREHWAQLRFPADRDRLFTGALLRRVVLDERAGRTVPVARRCRGCGAVDHGEVQPSQAADRARWRTSLSHSGGVVLLAVAELAGVDVDVGVDVESVSRLESAMGRLILSAAECSGPARPTPWELCRIWTAKEAVLKSLGCGLHASMTDLELGPENPAAEHRSVRAVGADPLLRPLRERPARLVDLTNAVSASGREGALRRAALMVLGAEEVSVAVRRLAPAELAESTRGWLPYSATAI